MDIELIMRERIERVLMDSANECYDTLMEEGLDPLVESGEDPIKTLDNLIGYFESQEDYSKCANLLKLKNSYEA